MHKLYNKIYGQKKWWQNDGKNQQKNIKKHELILKSGNCKKSRNVYKIRGFKDSTQF